MNEFTLEHLRNFVDDLGSRSYPNPHEVTIEERVQMGLLSRRLINQIVLDMATHNVPPGAGLVFVDEGEAIWHPFKKFVHVSESYTVEPLKGHLSKRQKRRRRHRSWLI